MFELSLSVLVPYLFCKNLNSEYPVIVSYSLSLKYFSNLDVASVTAKVISSLVIPSATFLLSKTIAFFIASLT